MPRSRQRCETLPPPAAPLRRRRLRRLRRRARTRLRPLCAGSLPRRPDGVSQRVNAAAVESRWLVAGIVGTDVQ